MSKQSHPLIVPGSEANIIRMFRESMERIQSKISAAHDLIERFGDGDLTGRFDDDTEEMICDGLNLLINSHEESIVRILEGIAELEKVTG